MNIDFSYKYNPVHPKWELTFKYNNGKDNYRYTGVIMDREADIDVILRNIQRMVESVNETMQK